MSFFSGVRPTRSLKKKRDWSLVFRGIHSVNENVLGVPWPHHEGGLVSTHVGGGAVLGHVGFLRRLDILLLLLDPVGGDLKHQTLRDKTAMSDELDEQNSARANGRFGSHLQMMPAARRHLLSPESSTDAALETGKKPV